MLLRQVQAGPLPGHHLRALRRGGHPVQGAARADGPHRAGRPGGAHLVPAGHPQLAGLPAHGHRGPRGAQGQAAGEGHLLRRQPGHLGRRGQAPRGPARSRGRAGRGDRRHREEAGRRHRPPLQGPRGRAGRSGEVRGQGHRDQGPPAQRGEGDHRGPRALPERDRAGPADLRRVQEPPLPQDPRGRDALARAAHPLRGLLRGRHGRRDHLPADRPHRPRRRRGQAPRDDRRRRRAQAPVGTAPPEGHQAAQDRHRLQPARRERAPGQRPPGHDPRLGAGHPARPAPDGPARRWPVRHLRPERPLPAGHQPEQPAEEAARPGRARRSSSTTRSGCCKRRSTPSSTTAAGAGR